MTRIGLLSDTHAYWDEKYLEYFEPCDEIWHAGDIGSLEVAERLAAFRPFRAVYGNIDGQEIRKLYPQINRFTVDGAEVLIKHIGGYPGKYDPSIIGSLMTRPPKLFISGHSHILKVNMIKRWICCILIRELPACPVSTKYGLWYVLLSTRGPFRTWKSSNWRTNKINVPARLKNYFKILPRRNSFRPLHAVNE